MNVVHVLWDCPMYATLRGCKFESLSASDKSTCIGCECYKSNYDTLLSVVKEYK